MELLSRARARTLALAAAAALAACRDPSVPDDLLGLHDAVYAVTEVGSTRVTVVAHRIEEDGEIDPLAGLTGTLTGPGLGGTLVPDPRGVAGCFPAFDRGDDTQCYTIPLSAPIRAGDRYALDLVTPDGRRIRGAMTAPLPPTATVPADSQRVTVVEFRTTPTGLPILIVPLVLEAAPGSGRVDAWTRVRRAWVTRLDPVTRTPAPVEIDASGCQTRDALPRFRTTTLPAEQDLYVYRLVCDPPDWDSLDLAVHLVGSEPNYTAYAERVLEGFATPGEGSFGMEGAAGVFGGRATAELIVRVIYQR